VPNSKFKLGTAAKVCYFDELKNKKKNVPGVGNYKYDEKKALSKMSNPPVCIKVNRQ